MASKYKDLKVPAWKVLFEVMLMGPPASAEEVVALQAVLNEICGTTPVDAWEGHWSVYLRFGKEKFYICETAHQTASMRAYQDSFRERLSRSGQKGVAASDEGRW